MPLHQMYSQTVKFSKFSWGSMPPTLKCFDIMLRDVLKKELR